MALDGWRQVRDELVPEAVRGLLEAYELPVERLAPWLEPPTESPLVASIGFTSEQLSGTLTLCFPPGVLAKTGADSPNAASDWAGELANQVLGRLKNRLLPYGVELQIALPVVVSGHAMVVHADDELTCRSTFFTQEGGIGVAVTARVDEGFAWVACAGEGRIAACEGDMLLF